MSPHDERELYARDHHAWVVYMAPRLRALLKGADAETKRDAWNKASPALRDEINRIARLAQ